LQAYVGFDKVNHSKLSFKKEQKITIQDRHLCCPLLLPWSRTVPPTSLTLSVPQTPQILQSSAIL